MYICIWIVLSKNMVFQHVLSDSFSLSVYIFTYTLVYTKIIINICVYGILLGNMYHRESI